MATQGHSHVSSRKGRFCALALWSPWRERYVLASFSGNSGWPPIWTMHTQETMQQRPHRTRDLQRHVHIPHASIVSVWTFIPNVDITCPETTTVTSPPPKEEKRKTRETPRVFNPEGLPRYAKRALHDVSPFRPFRGQKWKVTICGGSDFPWSKKLNGSDFPCLLALTKIDRLELVISIAALWRKKIFLTGFLGGLISCDPFSRQHRSVHLHGMFLRLILSPRISPTMSSHSKRIFVSSTCQGTPTKTSQQTWILKRSRTQIDLLNLLSFSETLP